MRVLSPIMLMSLFAVGCGDTKSDDDDDDWSDAGWDDGGYTNPPAASGGGGSTTGGSTTSGGDETPPVDNDTASPSDTASEDTAFGFDIDADGLAQFVDQGDSPAR